MPHQRNNEESWRPALASKGISLLEVRGDPPSSVYCLEPAFAPYRGNIRAALASKGHFPS